MTDLNAASALHVEQNNSTSTASKNQGSLKTEGKNYSISPFSDTESLSAGMPKFLENIGQPKELSSLEDHLFTHFPLETIETECEIAGLLQELSSKQQEDVQNPQNNRTTLPNNLKNPLPNTKQVADPHPVRPERSDTVHSSLFSLARSFNLAQTEARQRQNSEQTDLQKKNASNERALPSIADKDLQEIREFHQNRQDREKQREKDQEQQEEHRQGQREEEQNFPHAHKKASVESSSLPQLSASSQKTKEKKVSSVQRPTRKSSRYLDHGEGATSYDQGGGVDSIYIRFMALMARILGQAEAEAHDLYLRIKERTDNIDILTLLISKVNATKGDIDWSENEEMKLLLSKARSLGVEIPEGKEKWTEEEKKLFKENIQMRKDSMEKLTQLERTDMQRYLQEASQCHQARSNILKLLKEVMDTIIANMRA